MATRSVLLVDHHDDCRRVYATVLRYGGYLVVEARNGAEALELIPARIPDAVVTELTLPVVDGCELLRHLKEHPEMCHIPVIVVTADARPESRQRAVEVRCDAFLVKPCPPRVLLEIVRGTLG